MLFTDWVTDLTLVLFSTSAGDHQRPPYDGSNPWQVGWFLQQPPWTYQQGWQQHQQAQPWYNPSVQQHWQQQTPSPMQSSPPRVGVIDTSPASPLRGNLLLSKTPDASPTPSNPSVLRDVIQAVDNPVPTLPSVTSVPTATITTTLTGTSVTGVTATMENKSEEDDKKQKHKKLKKKKKKAKNKQSQKTMSSSLSTSK